MAVLVAPVAEVGLLEPAKGRVLNAVIPNETVGVTQRRRPLKVIGPLVGSRPAVARLAAGPQTINARTVELCASAPARLLAVAAVATKTCVAHRQLEIPGQLTISSVLELAARLHVGTTSVACVAVSLVVACSLAARRARKGRSCAGVIVTINTCRIHSPNRRSDRPFTRTACISGARIGAEAECGIKLTLAELRPNY